MFIQIYLKFSYSFMRIYWKFEYVFIPVLSSFLKIPQMIQLLQQCKSVRYKLSFLNTYIFLRNYQHSFSLEIGSWDYCVYRGRSRNNMAVHQSVKVTKETNEESIHIDPYYGWVTISRLDETSLVNVGHISKEVPNMYFAPCTNLGQ